MNKYKISVGINIILMFLLIVCLFLQTKKSSEKDPVKETAIELLNGMIEKAKDDYSIHFKYFERDNSYIRKKIDKFYVLKEKEDAFSSPKLMNYYKQEVSNNSQETEMIFNTLYSIKDKQSQDFILMSKLMEYRFIEQVIEDCYLRFVWFNQIEVRVISKKDTIRLGEENHIEIGLVGFQHSNTEQPPIIVFDGDTCDIANGYFYCREKPKKRGLVIHEGYMTYFHPINGIQDLGFKFRYYVK